MERMIVVTSGKGGVGKSTTAINLGAAMVYFGEDVLVVDGNLTTPNIGIILNSPEVPISLNHVLLKKATLVEAVYEHGVGFKIIPSSLSIKDLDKLNYNGLTKLKKDFKKISKNVIIDCAAGLGSEARSVIELADELIIVTNPELPAITDALKTIRLAQEMKKHIMGVIVTKVKKDDIEMRPESVKDMLETPILGMVPEDDCVRKSISMKDSVISSYPKSKSSRAYKEIAAKILGVPYNSDKEKERLIERVLKKLGLRKD